MTTLCHRLRAEGRCCVVGIVPHKPTHPTEEQTNRTGNTITGMEETASERSQHQPCQALNCSTRIGHFRAPWQRLGAKWLTPGLSGVDEWTNPFSDQQRQGDHGCVPSQVAAPSVVPRRFRPAELEPDLRDGYNQPIAAGERFRPFGGLP